MKIFAKGLAFALLAVVVVQLASMDMANAHDKNKVKRVRCQQVYESMLKSCRDICSKNYECTCYESVGRGWERCKSRYPVKKRHRGWREDH